jgi:hypothetical protein
MSQDLFSGLLSSLEIDGCLVCVLCKLKELLVL